MDEKRRSKRKSMDDGFWDCSVCTYRNTPEAFKCDMCDVRKGTSTRKPRLNPQLVAQQVAQQFPTPAPKKASTRKERDHGDERGDHGDTAEEGEVAEAEDESTGEALGDRVGRGPDSTLPSLDATTGHQDSDPSEPGPGPGPVGVVSSSHSAFAPPPRTKATSTPNPSRKDTAHRKSGTGSSTGQARRQRVARLKNIDRSSGTSMEVTVGDLTVIITDYKPKKLSAPSDKTAITMPTSDMLGATDKLKGGRGDSMVMRRPGAEGASSSEAHNNGHSEHLDDDR